MRNIRKCLGLGLLSLVLAASGPACAMAGQAGPGAAYKPSVNGISIYVSKKGNTVTLNRYNSTIGSWPAQIGRESAAGDKVQQGDGITPSGKFYVCTKNDQSQYYLSLGLSYPGIEDAERGLADGLINEEQYKAIVDANKAGEQPPWDTPLGGAINTMPAIICGLLFAGIISATMSSSDSDLLGAGSIFANDIYKAVLKPDASSQSVMRVTKIVMCLVGVASMLIALFNTQSIVSILMFCFTLRAAGSFFPYVMGHYWKKASTAGTIASLIAGTIVVVYLEHVSKGMLFGIKFSQPIIPGLVAAFICFIIFSYAMPPKVESTELAPEEDD